MKIAIVVQRYGADISGGAELHARYIAEHLGRHADVQVLTTCARDYLTWRNEFAPGHDDVNGIAVERFPVVRERSEAEFGLRSDHVFSRRHSLNDELAWLDSEGPASPALLESLSQRRREFDFVLLFCVRYFHAYHAARLAPERAVLVPTAERDPALGLAIFAPIFRGVRGIMYNSPEEQMLIRAVACNDHVPGVVVGIGSEIPDVIEPARAKTKFGLTEPYVVYVGRIDINKGCAELFDFYARYAAVRRNAPQLVLIGRPAMEMPRHPLIRHLGFVDDHDKFDVIAGATALVMPSYYESLSMVALEAWALGTPVIANAHCDVLLGQCLRSNAGLYYANADEFCAVLDRIITDDVLAATLGRNGRQFYEQHYSWPVIEKKYLDMFEFLSSSPPAHRMERNPGWFARRIRSHRPAGEVMDELPSGPVVDPRRDTGSPASLSGLGMPKTTVSQRHGAIA
jgi:glycosyltransferase involved in cell wall biosynthesis